MDLKSKYNIKKALSSIVATIFLILLAIVAVGTTWVFVNNIINSNIDKSKSCFGNFGEISINSKFTCYNSANTELQFSINIGDVEIDELLISVSTLTDSKQVKLTNSPSTISGLSNYPDGTTNVKLPDKNGGNTYVLEVPELNRVTSIKIAPKVNGHQCDVADSLNSIEEC